MNAPTFAVAIDDGLELSPYQQIVAQVRALIERGDLAPGAPLPTVRQLAGDLGVAPNTVARAYTDLQMDGWLVGEGRRGTRVASRTPNVDPRARSRALRNAITDFVNGLRHRGFTMQEIQREVGLVLDAR
jgi:GntR family transcriptional regulator